MSLTRRELRFPAVVVLFSCTSPALLADTPAPALCREGGAERAAIAEVKRLARGKPEPRQSFTLCGQVTLRPGDLPDDPRNFYIQDSTGGLSIIGEEPPRMSYGQWVLVTGWLAIHRTGEIELEAARQRIVGPGRMPKALEISPGAAASGKYDGWHVAVQGEVISVSIGETRDGLALAAGGGRVEAYTRRPLGSESLVAKLAPLRGRVRVSGVIMPTESSAHSRIRIRGPSDLELIEAPPWFTHPSAKAGLGVAVLLLAAVLAWIVTLQRCVRSQTRQIRELLAGAEEDARLKTEYLANVSHEVRTPLNGMIGLMRIMQDEPDCESNRDHLKLVYDTSGHLVSLLNSALDYARLESGAEPQTEHEPFSPREILRQSVGVFGALAAGKNLALELEDRNLPAVVAGDATVLRQVLTNLVSNAVKFTERGSVRATGWSEETETGYRLHFEVRDTGIGVDPEQLPRIFDAYRQADGSIRRRYGGSGLGLALALKLVRLMGGEIRVDSEPGAGTVFSFHVLCGKAAFADQDCGQDGERTAVRPMRVLLAEDNKLNQLVAKRMLERSGHAVAIVDDGAGAIAEARKGEFDIVLMDIQMPGVDGIEACRTIRRFENGGRRTPILALTAQADPADHLKCLSAGMDGVVTKPVCWEDLEEKMAGTLSRLECGTERQIMQ